MKVELDLNADLGEGEDPKITRALMQAVDSASVACGGHAGDVATMDATVALAAEFGVRVGAHPGFADRADFGRHVIPLSHAEFRLLLLQQVGALCRVLARYRLPLSHIKLHGALYHAVESDNARAKVYLETVETYFPEAKVYAFAGGRICGLAAKFGVDAWGEAFVERGYGEDGLLIPRGMPGSMLVSAEEITRRVRQLAKESKLASVAGTPIAIRARTLCIHADTPNAERIAKLARSALKNL